MGRPAANISREQILMLAARFWKPKQIAALFSVSERTIYNYATAAEMESAKELGKGELIEMAWDRAAKDSKVLLHLLQYYREEVPALKLSEYSNEALGEELRRRIAASPPEPKRVEASVATEADVAKASPTTSSESGDE